MTDRPEIPEEAKEALAFELAAETGARSIRNAAGQYDMALLARAERLLTPAVPALRMQGAEEAEAQLREAEDRASRAEARADTLNGDLVDALDGRRDAEQRAEEADDERDQALAKGAEEERELLRRGGRVEGMIAVRLRDRLVGHWGFETSQRTAEMAEAMAAEALRVVREQTRGTLAPSEQNTRPMVEQREGEALRRVTVHVEPERVEEVLDAVAPIVAKSPPSLVESPPAPSEPEEGK